MTATPLEALDWFPGSWTAKPAQQQVAYSDQAALASVIEQIGQLPPLVTSWEIEQLRTELARAARGDAFVLQGGDCAESFDDCRSEPIAAKLKILLQMSLVLVHGTRKPVVRIGRIAGQYAKPRSTDVETRGDVTLPAYRGDIINRDGFTATDREPDPTLMLRAYERAGLTLNFIRSLVEGGFADLHHPEYWDVSFAKGTPNAAQYERIVESIRESLDFVAAITGVESEVLRRVDVFNQPRGARAALRAGPDPPGAAPARLVQTYRPHFPWIGMRTAQLDGAHVEFHRGIRNPLGIKIGSAMTTDWLLGLLAALDPEHQPGRITLIVRMGAAQVASKLPPAGRGGARRRPRGPVDVRSDARQHRDHRGRDQDPAVRQDRRRARAELRASHRAGLAARRRAHRAHRRERHRVHRRRARPVRRRSRSRVQEPRRSSPQLRAGTRVRDADRAASPRHEVTAAWT